MATKIESLPLNVVLQLAKAELMSSYKTNKVEIKGVGIDLDICDLDDDDECSLMVDAEIYPENDVYKEDRGLHPWVMVWDEQRCGFHTIMRLDQKKTDDQ